MSGTDPTAVAPSDKQCHGRKDRAGRQRAALAAALLAALAAAALLAPGCAGPRRSEKTSIVLITIDTMRADHLSCYGYYRRTTPAIDRLAAESVLFENVLTPMATTLPAHVSLLTSTHPLQHGIKGNFEQLERRFSSHEGLRTIAEMLSGKGFTNAAFVSATPVKRSSGLDAGFTVFEEPKGKERDATGTTERALRWLDRDSDEPFFLWIHYFDPHEPYSPPERYRVFRDEPGLDAFLAANRFPEPASPRVRETQNLYDGEVLHVDEQLGRVLEKLRERGLYDRVVIVVAGDHGEGLGQHDWMGHGHIYNEQLFVPLIIRFPDSMKIAPARKTLLGSLMDVLPTLAAAGILPLTAEERAQFEGIDLMAPPGAGAAGERYLLAERVNRERGWEPGLKYSLTGLAWKFVHLTEGKDELYDMQRDRPEMENVIEGHPELAHELKGRLLKEVASFEARANKRAGEGVPEEIIRELKSLGYVQ